MRVYGSDSGPVKRPALILQANVEGDLSDYLDLLLDMSRFCCPIKTLCLAFNCVKSDITVPYFGRHVCSLLRHRKEQSAFLRSTEKLRDQELKRV